MTTQVCSFCLGNDHYLRNKTIVTCPKLLLTQCGICYNFGHTTNFCKEKLVVSIKSEKPTADYSKPQSQIVKSSNKNKFLAIASRFAALDVKESDVDNTSDYDCDDETENTPQVSEQRIPEYEEYDDDELPPVSAIIWGKGFASNYKAKKWSD